MLQNAPMLIRFVVTLLLTAALAFGFRPLSKKLSSGHPAAEQELIGLGAIPLLAGVLMDSFLMAFQNTVLPFRLIAVVFLVGWGAIAFHWEPKVQKLWKVVLLHNLISAAVFVLICVQQLGTGQFWSGPVGAWSQLYHLPVLSLGYFLTKWSTSSFPAYIASFLLLGTASLIGCALGKRKRDGKRFRSLTAIGVRLSIFVFALWLLCMSILTWGTAQYVFSDLSAVGLDHAEYALMAGGLENWFSSENEYAQSRRNVPGAPEYSMNMAIARAKQSIRAPSFDGHPTRDDTFSVFRDRSIACDTAIVFLDKDGNILRESGDFIYFGYVPQEQWETGTDEASACGWIDISDGSDPRYTVFRNSYAGTREWYDDIDTIRITGYMDGSRIEPLAMAFSTQGMYYNALDEASPGWDTANEPGWSEEVPVSEDGSSAAVSVSGGISTQPPYSASELDAMGLLEWDVRFDNTLQADPTRELVTIYARFPKMTLYGADGPVRYQAEEYESLLALLKTMVDHRDDGRNTFYSGSSQFDMWDMVVFSSAAVYDLRDHASDGSEPFPDAEYTVLTAMRASPLKIAMFFLRNMYLLTFAASLLGLLYVGSRVRRHLIVPLRAINEGMTAGWTHIPALIENAPKWQEPYELWEHYRRTQDTLRNNKNELTRLNTALEYARTAEQNRRQMTSNIAHELKTPLAVIHSYAEGLKEHIAEDKREKYIDVILSEAERTDRMVLEMLDLSRLEAGKVKLSRDDFSLVSLVRSVFEKLDIAVQAKQLQLELSLPEECMVTADEGRIAQVIENFASNAVKYTPVGGHILVKVRTDGPRVTFSVENDSAPLSGEDLRKVWDTFYRADGARSGDGTGLGLAIAKNIIELHGGTCSARNTKTGVAFSFTI